MNQNNQQGGSQQQGAAEQRQGGDQQQGGGRAPAQQKQDPINQGGKRRAGQPTPDQQNQDPSRRGGSPQAERAVDSRRFLRSFSTVGGALKAIDKAFRLRLGGQAEQTAIDGLAVGRSRGKAMANESLINLLGCLGESEKGFKCSEKCCNRVSSSS
jgi:hypothetical protein